ncbi:MAG: hypothetical protein ACRDG3_07545, partial [Tepidiformaceae bacterium]
MRGHSTLYWRRLARAGVALFAVAVAVAMSNVAAIADGGPAQPLLAAAPAAAPAAATPQTGLNLPFVSYLPNLVKDDTSNGPATAVTVDKFGQGTF